MGGGQDGDKIHKKHAFKIHFRPFLVILDQLFLHLYRCGWVRPGTESSTPLCPYLLSQPNTTVSTNTHDCQKHHPPTVKTHPPQPTTTDTLHLQLHHSQWWVVVFGTLVVGGVDGWQQLMVAVDGSIGWQWWVATWKNFIIFFCSKWAKKPQKTTCFFLFLSTLIGGWVGEKEMWINPHFF